MRKGHADLYERMLCRTHQRFLLSEHVSGRRFLTTGPVVVIAAAKDTLGLVTEAFKEVPVTRLAVPSSDDVLLEVLNEPAAPGEPRATLTALVRLPPAVQATTRD